MRVIELKHRTKVVGSMTEYFVPYTARILREAVTDEWMKSAIERGEKKKNSFYKFAKKYRLEEDFDIRVIADDVNKTDSGLWINDPTCMDELSLWDYMADIESVIQAYDYLEDDKEACDIMTSNMLASRELLKRFKIMLSLLVYLDGNDYLDEDATVPWLWRAQMLSALCRFNADNIPDSDELTRICQDDDEYHQKKEALITDILISEYMNYTKAKNIIEKSMDNGSGNILSDSIIKIDTMEGISCGIKDYSISNILNVDKNICYGSFGQSSFALLDAGEKGRYYSFAGIREINHNYKSLRVLVFKLMLRLGSDFILAELCDDTIADTKPVSPTDGFDESKMLSQYSHFGDSHGSIDDKRDSYNKKELGLIKGTFSGCVQKLCASCYAGDIRGGRIYHTDIMGWKERRILQNISGLISVTYSNEWKVIKND